MASSFATTNREQTAHKRSSEQAHLSHSVVFCFIYYLSLSESLPTTSRLRGAPLSDVQQYVWFCGIIIIAHLAGGVLHRELYSHRTPGHRRRTKSSERVHSQVKKTQQFFPPSILKHILPPPQLSSAYHLAAKAVIITDQLSLLSLVLYIHLRLLAFWGFWGICVVFCLQLRLCSVCCIIIISRE